MSEHIDIIDFGKTLFLKPQIFFKRYFHGHYQPPFYVLVLSIFCIGYGIDRLEARLKPGGF